MRYTNTSITLPESMLKEATTVARQEGRTKSELFREALRRYMIEKQWQRLRVYGAKQAKKLGITEKDVVRLIHEYRREKRAKNRR